MVFICGRKDKNVQLLELLIGVELISRLKCIGMY